MTFEEITAKEMESAVLNNKWVGLLNSIAPVGIFGEPLKAEIDVLITLELDPYTGVSNWVGHLRVRTKEVVFKESTIFDYENWQTDAQNLGKKSVGDIMRRGLFLKGPNS